MDIATTGPIATVLDLIYTVVTILGDLLAPLLGSTASAGAIVALTLAVRTVLIPVGVSQVRAAIARRRMLPKLTELRRRWAKNPQRLQEETGKLYRRENVSPFASMLPTLLQVPVISLVYALFIHPVINGHSNALLTDSLAGVPLGDSLMVLLGSGQALWPSSAVFLVLLAVIALVATGARLLAARSAPPLEPGPVARISEGLSFLPYLTVVFAAFVPLAATLYLAVTTTWTLVERPVIRRILSAV